MAWAWGCGRDWKRYPCRLSKCVVLLYRRSFHPVVFVVIINLITSIGCMVVVVVIPYSVNVLFVFRPLISSFSLPRLETDRIDPKDGRNDRFRKKRQSRYPPVESIRDDRR